MEDKNINKGVIISSFVWKALEKVLSQGCNLVIQILLARLLLPSDFGALAIIVALVHYISVFVQSGLTTAVIQKKEISQTDLNTIFTISISIAAICYAFLFLLSPVIANYYHNETLTTPIRVSSTVLFLYSYNSIQMGVLSRRMEFKVIFFRTAIAVPLAGVVGLLLAYYGFGLWALISHFILNILLASIVMAIGTKVHFGFYFSSKSAKELYSFSIKILGANLISGFSDLFRTMTIGKNYTTAQLAYYDRGYTYANVVLQIVNNTIQSVLLPVFSRKQEDIDRVKEMSRKSISLTAFFVTPLLLGTAVIAKPLILLLLTEKWLPMVPFFMLFCVFRWAGCVVGIDKQVILALGRSLIIFYYEIFLLIANVIMLLVTVPMGIKSIAIGALIVEYIGSLVVIIIGKKVYCYSLKERCQDLYKPIINTVVMVTVIYAISYLKLSISILLIFQVIAGIFVYLFLAKITRDSSYIYITTITKGYLNRM